MSRLTLKCEKFGLSRGLRDLLSSGDLVDVTLACQGQYIQAHKTVLAACSPHFRSLFKLQPWQQPIVFLQDVELAKLEALVDFMYNGEVTVQQEDLAGLLRLAEALKVTGLATQDKSSEEELLTTDVQPKTLLSHPAPPPPTPPPAKIARRSNNCDVSKRATSPELEEVQTTSVQTTSQVEQPPHAEQSWVPAIDNIGSMVQDTRSPCSQASGSIVTEPEQAWAPKTECGLAVETLEASALLMMDDIKVEHEELLDLSEDQGSTNMQGDSSCCDEGDPSSTVPSTSRLTSTSDKDQISEPLLLDTNASSSAPSISYCDTSLSSPCTSSLPSPLESDVQARTVYEDADISQASIEAKDKTLHDLLSSSDEGLGLMNLYDKNKQLSGSEQDNLVALIVSHLLQKSEDKKISKSTFLWWSEAVEAKFSSQHKEIYYTPYCNTSTRANGKFYYRYLNVRAKYIERGLIQKSLTKLSKRPSPIPVKVTTELADALNFLRKSREPWDKVVKNWELTSAVRYNEITNEDKPIQDHISAYLAYELAQGPELFELDFKHLPLEARSDISFYTSFTAIRERIVDLAAGTATSDIIQNYNNAAPENDETRDLCALLLLPYILLTPKRTYLTTSGDRASWKPSLQESRDSFIVVLRSLDDLATAERKREEIAKHRKITSQPIIFVVAHNIQNISEVYVRIANLTYRVASLCKAVDVLFKAFQCLHISYPVACQAVWVAIQKVIYRINLVGDPQFTCVKNFMSRLNA